jgi:hypothetical protein
VLEKAAVSHPSVMIPAGSNPLPNWGVHLAMPQVALLPARPARPVAYLSVALVVLFGLAVVLLANAGIPQLGVVRVAEPAVLPAAPDDPVAFVWESRGEHGLLQMPGGGAAPSLLVDPYHLAIDPHGNIWVPDSWRDRFQILSTVPARWSSMRPAISTLPIPGTLAFRSSHPTCTF